MNNFLLAILAMITCALMGIAATLGVHSGELEGFQSFWMSLVSIACLPLTVFLAWCVYQERPQA